MKLALRSAWQGVGLAVLYLSGYIYPLIEPSHLFVYHLDANPSSIFVPVLIGVAVLATFIALLLVFAARSPGRRGTAIVALLFLFLPYPLAEAAYTATGRAAPHWAEMTLFLLSAAAFVAAVLLVPGDRSYAERLKRFATTVFSFAGVSGVLAVLQLFFCLFAAWDLARPLPLHSQEPAAVVPRKPGRLIWIVLDELSYQQVYERRFAGLQLPAFDKIASESVVFTHAIPAGIHTDLVLPSLISGVAADDIRSSRDGLHLSLHNAGSGSWQSFDPAQTVFADALAEHYSTAIVGLYVPYCRILSPVLDRCFWVGDSFPPASTTPHTALFRAIATVASAAERVRDFFWAPLARRRENALGEVGLLSSYEALAPAADRALEDPSESMLLIHMPMPHPGAFYSRRDAGFITHGGSYLDGLAFADKFLGHVRRVLEGRGEWNSDTILIMGDHSWRTKLLWRGSRGWTKEDEEASHGGAFDDRPGYIVKLPCETQGARFDRPMPAMRTRALIDALLNGQIVSTADLSAWVDAGDGAATVASAR